MIWLLGQILICLVLAALAGWFIGWSWRGFREADQVEDLRHTLRATEEVKDRELAEAQRRADGLQSRVDLLERRCEKLGDEIASARRRASDERGSDPGHIRLVERVDAGDSSAAPALQQEPDEIAAMRQRHELLAAELRTLQSRHEERESELATLRERGRADRSELDELRAWHAAREREIEELRAAARDRAADEGEPTDDDDSAELERALAAKTAELLGLEAELESLRQGADERAATLARLERRLVELEPLEERLQAREQEVAQLRVQVRESSSEANDDGARLRELDERAAQLEAALLERDRRINELRHRYQETAARLEVAEADQSALRTRLAQTVRPPDVAEPSPDLEDCRARVREIERELIETRATLQRQIERNRKQEAVHQQIVANLREELRDRSATSPPSAPAPSPTPSSPENDARVRQTIADRDSKIAALRGRLGELESELEGRKPPRPETDDLKKIHGIGPKIEALLNSIGIHRFEQIAAWTDSDIERMGKRLGIFRARIRWDDWVEGARRQHILRYGEPPERDGGGD